LTGFLKSYIGQSIQDDFKADVKRSIRQDRQSEADFGMKIMDWTGISEISQVTFPLFAWIASRRFRTVQLGLINHVKRRSNFGRAT
jgi:hypothetical protein